MEKVWRVWSSNQ